MTGAYRARDGRSSRHSRLRSFRWTAGRRWALVLALALPATLLALAALEGKAGAGSVGSPFSDGTPPSAEERAAALAAEIAAAKTHAIYLALDPRGGRLDLKVDGLLLRRFSIAGGLFGRPRFGGGGGILTTARFRLITELPEPERPLIPIRSPEGAGAGSSSLAVSEARAESMAQMPTHYRLRFQPPLEISVRGESGVATPEESALDRLWRLRFRLYEGWQAVGLRLIGQTVPPRIVLYLAPEQAQRLFMTLDPAMQLVISAPADREDSAVPAPATPSR